MILYKYTADCSKLNLEQEDSTKEGHESLYSRRSDITEWNSKFYTAYRTEKKFFIMISDCRRQRKKKKGCERSRNRQKRRLQNKKNRKKHFPERRRFWHGQSRKRHRYGNGLKR